MNPRPYRAHLDDLGSFVWRRCDGTTTVAEIAAAMRNEFGPSAEPVEDRLVRFLRQMEKGRFVEVRAPGPGEPEDP